MKRIFVCIILAAALVFTLCGCANGKIDDGIKDPTPTVAPDMIPETDDGVVKDEDGIIGDEKKTDKNSGTVTDGTITDGVTGGSTVSGNDKSVGNGTASGSAVEPSATIAPKR